MVIPSQKEVDSFFEDNEKTCREVDEIYRLKEEGIYRDTVGLDHFAVSLYDRALNLYNECERFVDDDEDIYADRNCPKYNECLALLYVFDKYTYERPKEDSPEQLIIDFYFLVYAHGVSWKYEHIYPEHTSVIQEELKKSVYKLKTLLLDSLFLAICAEMCHFEMIEEDNFDLIASKLYNGRIYKTKAKFNSVKTRQVIRKDVFIDLKNRKLSTSKFYSLCEQIESAEDYTYKQRQKIVKRYFKNRDDVVELAKAIFYFGRMEDVNDSYGGDTWLIICQGWTELNSAIELNDIIEKIDMVISLQHNSNTVFNKDKKFKAKGYAWQWILRLLDFKANVKDMKDYCYIVSPKLKRLAYKTANLDRRMGN